MNFNFLKNFFCFFEISDLVPKTKGESYRIQVFGALNNVFMVQKTLLETRN